MNRDIKNYIFDMDGTITDSSKEVLLCFEKAFEKSDIKIDPKRLNSDVIGPPLVEIIKLIAPDIKDDEAALNKVMFAFRKIYDYDENDITTLYDGIYDFLSELKNAGKHLFIATFKPMLPTKRVMKKLKLNMFEDVYTIDKFGEKISKTQMIEDIVEKYGLKKEETVMIGDAINDMKAAKQAGVTSIAAMWGYEADKEKLAASADFTVNNVTELKCQKLKSLITSQKD